MTIKLSVNLNKVCLLRNARGSDYPNLNEYMSTALKSGIDGITLHPRPDLRHATPKDIISASKFCYKNNIEFNIEGNPFSKKSKIYDGFDTLVNKSKAHQVTLVPDSADQITSNSGWTSSDKFDALKNKIKKYKENGSRVSIFINPSLSSYSFARSLNPDAIEIYTGPFAQIVKSGNKNKLNNHMYIIDEIINLALIDGILVNAGHDLNLDNLKYLVELSGFNEFSIGHAIIVDSLNFGYECTINKYIDLIKGK